MRKRLRKKLGRGEYQEFGLAVDGMFKSIPSDEVLDALIEAVEGLDMDIGGGIDDEGFSFVVNFGKDASEAKRDVFVAAFEKSEFRALSESFNVSAVLKI